MKTIKVKFGDSIVRITALMAKHTSETGEPTKAVFNGTPIESRIGDTAGDIHDRFWRARKAAGKVKGDVPVGAAMNQLNRVDEEIAIAASYASDGIDALIAGERDTCREKLRLVIQQCGQISNRAKTVLSTLE